MIYRFICIVYLVGAVPLAKASEEKNHYPNCPHSVSQPGAAHEQAEGDISWRPSAGSWLFPMEADPEIKRNGMIVLTNFGRVVFGVSRYIAGPGHTGIVKFVNQRLAQSGKPDETIEHYLWGGEFQKKRWNASSGLVARALIKKGKDPARSNDPLVAREYLKTVLPNLIDGGTQFERFDPLEAHLDPVMSRVVAEAWPAYVEAHRLFTEQLRAYEREWQRIDGQWVVYKARCIRLREEIGHADPSSTEHARLTEELRAASVELAVWAEKKRDQRRERPHEPRPPNFRHDLRNHMAALSMVGTLARAHRFALERIPEEPATANLFAGALKKSGYVIRRYGELLLEDGVALPTGEGQSALSVVVEALSNCEEGTLNPSVSPGRFFEAFDVLAKYDRQVEQMEDKYDLAAEVELLQLVPPED